ADELVYSAADTVVFLDYPKTLVLWRGLRRAARGEGVPPPGGAHPPPGLSALRGRGHPLPWGGASHAAPPPPGQAPVAPPGPAPDPALHPPRNGASVAAPNVLRMNWQARSSRLVWKSRRWSPVSDSARTTEGTWAGVSRPTPRSPHSWSC